MKIAIAIESLLDVDTLSLDNVTCLLTVMQDRINDNATESHSGGRLLLIEEEGEVRRSSMHARHGDGGSSSSLRNNHMRSGGGHDGSQGGHNAGSSDKSGSDKDMSRYCGIKGHWAQECRKKRREEAHVALVDKERIWHSC